MPLDDLVRRDQLNTGDYYPVGLQAYTYHGTLYGIPVKGSTITCFTNKNLFDRYGISYPTDDWTLDDLLVKAKALTIDEDRDGLPDIYGCTPYDIASYVWSMGGDFLRLGKRALRFQPRRPASGPSGSVLRRSLLQTQGQSASARRTAATTP